MSEPRELTITDAAAKIKNGELTARELVESCLERIRHRENSIHAWVELYEEQALKEADECDNAFKNGKLKGPLHGIPIGVKDIIDVKGMWTRAGSKAYKPRIAEENNPGVKKLRDAGAIILGKTETTAFANDDPAPTRNPWNTEHTPGGSSSGSGAAVADRMCFAALGTQTGGSVLRPAAYNGIVGLKPTLAYLSTKGVVSVSWTLDHVGIHARSVEDAEIVFNVMKEECPDQFAHTVACPPVRRKDVKTPFKLAYVKNFIEKNASSEVISHIESVKELLKKNGADIVDINFSEKALKALSLLPVLFATEQAAYHSKVYESRKELYPPKVKARIEKGLKTMACEYIDAVRQRIVFQNEMSSILSSVDAIMMPTAPTTAPLGLSFTGSPVFCEPFSLAGFPSVTIPSGLGEKRLPLAVELGCFPDREKDLLAMAGWCEKILSFDAKPE